MNISYYDWISYHARRTPQKIALTDVDGEKIVTYSDLDARVQNLSAALRNLYALKLQDRVMVLARTGPEVFEIQFACARAGTIFLPVNWRLSIPELHTIAEDSDPALIICEREFEQQAQSIANLKNIPIILIGDPGAHAAENPYEELVRKFDSAGFCAETPSWESTWLILYTSGTTGRPKGVMLSYRMMYFNALNFISPTKLDSSSTFLCAMPTFHTGGLSCYANPVLFCGGTVITMREFNAEKAFSMMMDASFNVSHFFGVPAMYLLMSQLPSFKDAVFPAMKIAGLVGAPATLTLIREWMSKGIPFQPAYGMTEIGPAITIMNEDRLHEKVGSSGQPVMNMDFRIVSATGEDVPEGTIGEIWVKGPVLLSGYWNRPDEMEKSLTDGWFRTGDAARMDEDGYVFIVDRYKDMYISGGENVYPTDVENVLATYPGVLTAAVIGVPDSKWGEVGYAYIMPRLGCQLDISALQNHCIASLAKFKLPKKYVVVDDFPRTASGKIMKNELRKLAEDISAKP